MTSTRQSNRNKIMNNFRKGAVALLFWLAVWQIAAMLIGKALILPSPLDVLQVLLRLIVTPVFWKNTLITLVRILSGYLLGILASGLLAYLTCSSPLAKSFIAPMIQVMRATPVASFIILALLWMGKARVPVLISMLMVIPIVWQNLNEAYEAIDPNLLEMGRAYYLNYRDMLRYIYLPAITPAFLSGCLSAMGLSWKSGIAAEVLSQPSLAIGTRLYNAKVYLETAELFAWTLCVILLSLCIEKGIRALFAVLSAKRR